MAQQRTKGPKKKKKQKTINDCADLSETITTIREVAAAQLVQRDGNGVGCTACSIERTVR